MRELEKIGQVREQNINREQFRRWWWNMNLNQIYQRKTIIVTIHSRLFSTFRTFYKRCFNHICSYLFWLFFLVLPLVPDNVRVKTVLKPKKRTIVLMFCLLGLSCRPIRDQPVPSNNWMRRYLVKEYQAQAHLIWAIIVFGFDFLAF